MVNAGEFGLPLQKFLELANLIREEFKKKDDKITEQATELVSVKEQLAAALADDAADEDKVAQAESNASSARDELAALREAIANDTNNQQLLAAIAALEGELGFTIPPAA